MLVPRSHISGEVYLPKNWVVKFEVDLSSTPKLGYHFWIFVGIHCVVSRFQKKYVHVQFCSMVTPLSAQPIRLQNVPHTGAFTMVGAPINQPTKPVHSSSIMSIIILGLDPKPFKPKFSSPGCPRSIYPWNRHFEYILENTPLKAEIIETCRNVVTYYACLQLVAPQ